MQSVERANVRWERPESPRENMRCKFDKPNAADQMMRMLLALFIHSASMQPIPDFEVQ